MTTAKRATITHRQVSITEPVRGFAAEVDEGIAYDVLLLWRNGIETVSSCQHMGHAGRQVGLRAASDLAAAVSLLPWTTCGTTSYLGYVSLTEYCYGDSTVWHHAWEKSGEHVTMPALGEREGK